MPLDFRTVDTNGNKNATNGVVKDGFACNVKPALTSPFIKYFLIPNIIVSGNATRMTSHILKCKKCPQNVKDLYTQNEKDVPIKRQKIQASRMSITSNHSNSNSNVSFDNDEVEAPMPLLHSDDEINSTHSLKYDQKPKIQDTQALSLICHGWVDEIGKGIINFVVTSSKPIYFITCNLEQEIDAGDYIGQKMLDVIEEFGSSKFTAIVANNDSNIKQAWRLVKQKYSQIACVGCISYGMNMLCMDMLKIDVFKTTLQKVFKIIKHIQNSENILELFEKQQIEHYGTTKCSLKMPSKTRLIGAILALNSFKSNKDALQGLVDNNVNSLDTNTTKDILNEEFWYKIDETLNILQISSELIQSLESENATLSDVPVVYSNFCKTIADQLNSNTYFTTNDIEKIKSLIHTRKNICVKPIHLAANLIDPRYKGAHVEDDTPLATEFINDYASFIYRNDDEKISKILANIASFKTNSGYYGKSNSIWKPVRFVTPSVWWRTFAPGEVIAPLAIRLLSVPPSSAGRSFNSFEGTNAVTSTPKYFKSTPSIGEDRNVEDIPEKIKTDDSFEFIETDTLSEEE